MPKAKNTTSLVKTKVTRSNAKKINMTGGAFSEETSAILFVGLMILLAIIMASLIYINIHKKDSRERKHIRGSHMTEPVQSSYRNSVTLSNDNDSSNDKVPIQIQLVTNNQVEDRPAIYPRNNPEYPMQRRPQGYQQVGVLVSKDSAEDKPIIMPLFGRKMYSKDRWEYYTASDEYHMWRIPVMINNRDCQDDVGCDEIYNGDNVTVPDYANKVFLARIYKYRDPQTFSEILNVDF
jgi:hypothetical protein